MDEARSEGASQSGQQQECILSGGVYLRHRWKDNFCLSSLIHSITTIEGVQHWRTGVLACKKLSLFLT